MLEAHHGKSSQCQVCWSQALQQWKYNDFSLSHNLAQLRDERVNQLYGLEPVHHTTKFVGHRHCRWKYNGFLQSRNLARSYDQSGKLLYSQESLKVCHHPNKFGGHRHCGSKDIIYLVCHVICEKHVIKEPCNFMVAIITLVIRMQWLLFFT